MKLAVVTGAAQGLGLCTSELLARRGFRLLLLAAEWGARGVRVNAVCPGWIKTAMDTQDQGSGAYSDTDIIDRVPMARFARPEDVAEAIAFLADSERSAFVNGITLPVDGGWTADASWESLRLKTRE